MRPYRYVIPVLLFLIPILAYPAIIHVPGDHLTIQSAIDVADNGDTILIADGVYSGPGNIGIQWDATQKHLVIMSEHGRDHCTIDCQGEDRAFLLNNGQDQRDLIDGLTITNGFVYGPGGAILLISTSPRITNCSLENNTSYCINHNSDYGGGAITVYDSAAPVIQGNIIRFNSTCANGGGIKYDQNAAGVLENNIIEGNTSAEGGGGGISVSHFSSPLIINNLIANNTSGGGFDGGNGGGISSSHSDPLIVNNTIAYNRTAGNEYTVGRGGGIAISKWQPFAVIRNCIIWNNVAGASTMNIEWDLHEWMDITYCNVEEDLGHIFDLKPHTNIDSIPGFKDPESGDFSLSWNSPCINKGNSDTTGLYLPAYDLAGNDRVFEGRVDIGAYEYNRPSSLPAISNQADFRVYPNPSSGLITLKCRMNEAQKDLVICIYSSIGEMVYLKTVHKARAEIPINISQLSDGIFFMTVSSNRHMLYQQKIIKK